MSGFVGILHPDGSSVDPLLLRRLTNFLTFRGPDAQKTWLDGQIGLGAAFLHVSPEDSKTYPFCPDGDLRIVADARIDARAELISQLRHHGCTCTSQDSDVELILRAYQLWSENCVEHLIGDFSFAIWDGARRRLFCARDQMGVKPFFYASIGPLLIFSNTLDCIRQHPSVSDRLNETSIADFLIFDFAQDESATAFAEIQRLPPAHTLLHEQDRLATRRYWQPPVVEPVQFRRPADYIDCFNELLDTAVADRLRTPSACVFMSGGLDSPTVAASARRVSARPGESTSIWAYTQVFDYLIPHEERRYAGLVARALQIPIEYRADDHLSLFQYAKQPGYHSPEPAHTAWPDVTSDQLRRVQTVSRVVLTGFGADPLFSSRITVHFQRLLQQRRFGRALTDALGYLSVEGRLSRLYLRTRLRILFSNRSKQIGGFMPAWLNDDLVQRLHLRERWEEIAFVSPGSSGVRPEAYAVTFAPFWPEVFNRVDSSVTGVPVEVRHPFFDLRLVNYLLALPRLPWCSDKQLLRDAARDYLPREVRLRRKSPLKADPLLALLRTQTSPVTPCPDPQPELAQFVTAGRVPRHIDLKDSWQAWVHLRPRSLNHWLKSLRQSSTNDKGGPDYAVNSAYRFKKAL
jgi:asparagine synthase (glutamine-hydrolysing)